MNSFVKSKANNQALSHRKPLFGIGINDAWYSTHPKINGKIINCPSHTKWSNMFQRCYSDKYHQVRPTYKDCYVSNEWYSFSQFNKWIEIQPGWEELQLDKDILFEGNKEYSSKTCVLVPRNINMLLASYEGRGLLPVGVHRYRSTNKYIAQVNNGHGYPKYLGTFKTKLEAHNIYCAEKANIIRESANNMPNYIDLRVKNRLFEIAKEIEKGEYYQ